uniref:Uncharacterized protein n=1 Tax=Knipowitschia caucasica TaxID=637954 RepID=A0AAV2L4R2_KNICA
MNPTHTHAHGSTPAIQAEHLSVSCALSPQQHLPQTQSGSAAQALHNEIPGTCGSSAAAIGEKRRDRESASSPPQPRVRTERRERQKHPEETRRKPVE